MALSGSFPAPQRRAILYNSHHVIGADSIAEGAYIGVTDAGEGVITRIPRFGYARAPAELLRAPRVADVFGGHGPQAIGSTLFCDARARLIDIAAFLDRLDRAEPPRIFAWRHSSAHCGAGQARPGSRPPGPPRLERFHARACRNRVRQERVRRIPAALRSRQRLTTRPTRCVTSSHMLTW